MNPTKMSAEKNLKKMRAIKNSLTYFARNFLWIKTKDAKIVPLELNQSQIYFHQKCEAMRKRTGKVRVIVVKGRQSGISTYVAARFYHRTITRKATGTFILSHEASTTDKLFKMVKLFQEKNAIAPAVKKSNSRELDFESTHSSYYVGTAGSGDVGRGGTVQLLHGSEVALWKNTDDIQTGLMESVPDMPNTEIILESTAKGMGNFFHRMVVDSIAGKNEYEVVFIPWFWMSEYEDSTERFSATEKEQEYAKLYLQDYDEETQLRKLVWRRAKIGSLGREWKFKQEYPSNVQEAFQTSTDTLIKAEDILKARKNKIINNRGHLVIGVDPARTGDRIGIVFRRGRVIERVIKLDHTGDDMVLVGKIAEYIGKYDPIACNIDCTNSYAIYDRLKELGYGCANGIHFSHKAIEHELYLNKRVEMWCNLRDWIEGGDVDIPDNDEFHIDLTSVPDYLGGSDTKIRLVSKDKIKEVCGLSPDLGDAAALTFAVPINERAKQVKKANGGGLKSTQRMKKKR